MFVSKDKVTLEAVRDERIRTFLFISMYCQKQIFVATAKPTESGYKLSTGTVTDIRVGQTRKLNDTLYKHFRGGVFWLNDEEDGIRFEDLKALSFNKFTENNMDTLALKRRLHLEPSAMRAQTITYLDDRLMNDNQRDNLITTQQEYYKTLANLIDPD